MTKLLRASVCLAGLWLHCVQALAQVPVVGILWYGSSLGGASYLAAFREGLREQGFIEGQNLRIEQRFADYDSHKVNRVAEDLVRAKVQVIFAPTTWAVHGAKSATTTIPIVFSSVNDPVAVKFVKSLRKPGGNITGVSIASGELTAKRLELIREVFPSAAAFGVVYDQDAAKACQIELKDIAAAGTHLGVRVREFPYLERADVSRAFESGRRAGIGAVLIPTTMEVDRFGSQISAESASSRIPTMHSGRRAVEEGGLMSYGPDLDWAYRRAGNYVGRILKGADPSALPVERPSTYELVVNLKTARAMGIRIPNHVLLRATHVIE